MKKIFFIAVMLVTVITLTGITYAETKLEKVQIQMHWYPDTTYGPLILGKILGYYAEEGLDPEFIPGKGSTISTKMVALGKFPLGIASGNSALIARTKGMPLKVVAAFYQKSPGAIFFRKSSGIKIPKDLIGKTVASDPKSSKHVQFFVFLDKNGVNAEKIKLMTTIKAGELKRLICSEVDCALFYVYKGIEMLQRKELGVNLSDFGYFLFDNYGVIMFDHSIITNEQTIKNNPELVRKFTRATLKAWNYAITHPRETAKALAETYGLNEQQEYVRFTNALPLTKSEDTDSHWFGYMSKQRWLKNQDVLLTTKEISGKINLSDFFTNEFQ